MCVWVRNNMRRPRLPPHCCCSARVVTSCCHHHPSLLYPTHVYLPPPPFLCLSPLTVPLPPHQDAGGPVCLRWPWQQKALEEETGNKYLKGGGTQLSQMCRNRHSIPPSEAKVSKARGLLFVFFSEALRQFIKGAEGAFSPEALSAEREMGEITSIMWMLRAINSSCLMLAPIASLCAAFSPSFACFCTLVISLLLFLSLAPTPTISLTLPRLFSVYSLCLRAQTVDTNENATSFGLCWSLNNDIIRLQYAPVEIMCYSEPVKSCQCTAQSWKFKWSLPHVRGSVKVVTLVIPDCMCV